MNVAIASDISLENYPKLCGKINEGSLCFRKLTEADVINDNGFVETLSALRPVDATDKEKLKEIFHDRISQGIDTYVLAKKGRVVATGSLLIERKFFHEGGRVAHIEDVASHPKKRGKGLGKCIIAYLKQEAWIRKCYKVILDCNPDNVGFYQNCGFKEHEIQMRLDFDLKSKKIIPLE